MNAPKLTGGAVSTRTSTSCACCVPPPLFFYSYGPTIHTVRSVRRPLLTRRASDDGRDGSRRLAFYETRRDEISPSLPPKKSSVVGSRKGPHSPPQPSPPAAQSKSPLQPGDDAQAALPPPAAPPRRRGRPLLTGRPGCGGGQGGAVGGAHGADGPGGRGGAEPERDAAAAGELPALRALHLLRRAQGRLRPLPVLLRHQLQHPQPPLRILLLHAQVVRLPPLQRLT